MQLRITKLFAFEMAHALTDYEGRCSNIHGHSYKLAVTVSGEAAASPLGMVIDFSCLKAIVQEHVVEPFDHALVLSTRSPYPHDLPTKTVMLPFEPTTENLLQHFAALLSPHLPEGIALCSLRLQETENSYAELVF